MAKADKKIRKEVIRMNRARDHPKEKELYNDKDKCKFGELKHPALDGRVCRKIPKRKSEW